jgi:hypothetical protein
MRNGLAAGVMATGWLLLAAAQENSTVSGDKVHSAVRVLPEGAAPSDQRKSMSRTIISGFPLTLPATAKDWEIRREAIRRQVLVAEGLWPVRSRPRVDAVVHSKVEKEGYTIEKVFFESLPGHFVCGNLYRPVGESGRRPAVLFPHGHFGDGRLQEVEADEVARQLKSGGESYESNARYPVQAPLVTLAKMGCVVFQYDMVGRGDSRALAHKMGFDDAQAVLRLQSFMGLQTFHSVRSLDFLCQVDDVDASRIGVTGASGGGTQTIVLGAIDDRVRCAFPAVMVSTSMQGGCVCENAPLLRIGMGNVDIAACLAPRALGMTTAQDWTLHFERKGFPELQSLYAMLGAPANVMAQSFPQFKHNFNQLSREVMYQWMDKHLELGAGTTKEMPIDPVLPSQLSVFDEKHRVTWGSVEELRAEQTKLAEKFWRDWQPSRAEEVEDFQEELRGALEVMVGSRYPRERELKVERIGSSEENGVEIQRLILSRVADPALFAKEAVPGVFIRPANWDGEQLIVWIDAAGHAGLFDEGTRRPGAEVELALQHGAAVLSVDVLLTGEHLLGSKPVEYPKVSMENPKFTLTYNRSVLSQRVHDVLSAAGCAKHVFGGKRIDFVGFGEAGPWVILARSLCRDEAGRTVADFDQFSFGRVMELSDPMLLPGGLRYGDLSGLASLMAPGEVFVRQFDELPPDCFAAMKNLYALAGKSDAAHWSAKGSNRREAIDWLLRP